MNIQEVRAQYPQYSDLTNEQLARGMHAKFYADMPFEQFADKIGLKSTLFPRTAATGDVGPAPESDPLFSLKNIAEFGIKHAPEIGSIAGGIAGAVTPLPGGALVGTRLGSAAGSLLGTIAGTSIGTSVKQIAEGKPETATERLKEHGINVAEQSAYDLLGSTIGTGLAKGLEKLSPSAREGAGTAQALLTAKGGSMSGAQAVQSPTVDLAESFARAGAGGKGQFVALDKRNLDAIEAIKGDLLQRITSAPPNDRVAGKLFHDAMRKGEGAHSVAASALYKDFEQRAANVAVDSAPIANLGRSIADQFKAVANVGKSEAGGRLIDQLANVPNTLTFSDAHFLRSNLLATVRDLKISGTELKALATAQRAAKLVDEQMEAAAKGLPVDLFNEYRGISAFYRKGKEAFNNDLVQTLVSKEPERVGEALFRSGNVSEIIQARASLRQAELFDKSVNAKDALNRLRAGYLNALLTSKSALSREGETTAANMMKELASARTSRQFNVMFSGEQHKAIDEFARTAFLVLNNKPAAFGILAPLLQAAAIGDLALGASGSPVSTQSPLKDVGVIVSPYVLAKVLTNPKAVSVLVKGLKLPLAAVQVPAVITKLTGDMTKAMQESSE